MIITVITILTALVAFNFLLLFFSCNKTSKVVETKKPLFIQSENTSVKIKKPEGVTTTTAVSKQLEKRQLAPTGS